MLILTRKIDQSIIISGNIQIMVLGVERDRVKLGIAAPAEITVLREELLAEEALPSTALLRRRGPRPNLTPTHGSLALQPEAKDD
ncbi:MAG TPA: carbon storage regulator [Dehalococcoidia bacterium]